MKYLTFALLSLGIILNSCNHKDEPPTEVTLPIIEDYLPVSLPFNKNDETLTEKIKVFSDKNYVVNDLTELPNDPIGFSNAYNSIDFKKYTLLIAYDVTSYTIETYKDRYSGNNFTKTYNWYINIGTSTIPDSNAEEHYFTRYSILVSKLSADADINIQISRKAINWGWE